MQTARQVSSYGFWRLKSDNVAALCATSCALQLAWILEWIPLTGLYAVAKKLLIFCWVYAVVPIMVIAHLHNKSDAE